MHLQVEWTRKGCSTASDLEKKSLYCCFTNFIEWNIIWFVIGYNVLVHNQLYCLHKSNNVWLLKTTHIVIHSFPNYCIPMVLAKQKNLVFSKSLLDFKYSIMCIWNPCFHSKVCTSFVKRVHQYTHVWLMCLDWHCTCPPILDIASKLPLTCRLYQHMCLFYPLHNT